MDNYELKVTIEAVADKFEGTINKVKSSLQSLPTGLDGVTAKLDSISKTTGQWGKSLSKKVTAPLVAMGTVGVKKFAEVDQTMQLTNATMGNTAEQAELLDKAMKTAAANSTFGMTDAATATLNFARAGLTAEEAASALAPAMNLAAGEGGNLDTVSAGLTATINGFGDTFDKASSYADVFANACNNSALDIDSLSNAMSIAAPIFKTAGYSVNDAALYMGVMANAGIDANVAANALKTGMARLIEPSKQGAAWMEKLGISVTNADGSMKDSVTVQKELHDAFSGLSESEQIAAASAIFGKNQMSNWLALINTAPGDVDALSTALGKEGTTAEMAEAMMSGFGGSLEKLKSSIDVAVTSFGEALAPTISAVAEKIQAAVDWFNGLSESQQRTVAKIAMVVAAIGPLLLVISKVTKSVSGLIKLNQKTEIFSKLFKLPPSALLVVGIIAAIAAAVIYLWNTNEEFRAAMIAAWEQIKAALLPVAQAFKAAWDAVLPAIQNVISVIGGLIQALAPTIAGIVSMIADAITTIAPIITSVIQVVLAVATVIFNVVAEIMSTTMTVVTAIVSAIGTAIQAVQAAWTAFKTFMITLWNAIKSVATTVWNGIKATIQNVINAIKAIANTLTEPVKAVFTKIATHVTNAFNKIKTAWQGVKDFAMKIATGISNAFSKMVSKVKSIINKFIRAANKGISVVNSLPGVSISHIPYLAHGTKDWQGGFAYMNERGGELTYLPNGAQVIPHDISVQYAKEAARANAGGDNTGIYNAMAGMTNALLSGIQMNGQKGGEYKFTVELGGARVAEQVFRLSQQGELIVKGA